MLPKCEPAGGGSGLIQDISGVILTEIDILVPETGCRRWHVMLAQRLGARGHDARLAAISARDDWPAVLESVLALEARLAKGDRLSAGMAPKELTTTRRAGALTIDLTGQPQPAGGGSVLSPLFDGQPSASAAAAALASNRLPTIGLVLDGALVAEARPMVDSRVMVGRGLEDVLARTISLIAAAVEKLQQGVLEPLEESMPAAAMPARNGALAGRLALSVLPRLARESWRRMRHWPFHWRVGYRFHEGVGVAETGLLGGPDWSILPDDGQRYYADPFPFEWKGRHYLFVEEYPHASGKGIISVAEFDGPERRPSTPRPVLEEPFHLSYPQVFVHGGEVWMLPEGGAGGELVLYRAAAFPDRWVRHAVLVENRELFDATLLEHGDRFWILAAERDGMGSSSDMLVVFHAEKLEGPWLPHKANPILIDRRAARPGGAFVKVGRRIVRPVQDGTTGYGGGLGLSDLIRLDEEAVRFSIPVPVLGARNWPYPRIHTLNRAGQLEVIDGIAEVPRR